MPQYETKRRNRHSATNMFELVADIERYPEFVPLCEKLVITSRETNGTGTGNEAIVATMTVAYKMFRESFTSRVELDRESREIRVTYLDGPFSFLENHWIFRDTEDAGCEIDFQISYEFRSKMLGSLMGAVFDRAFRRFATAFEARADKIYGKPSAENNVSSPDGGGESGSGVTNPPPAEAT